MSSKKKPFSPYDVSDAVSNCFDHVFTYIGNCGTFFSGLSGSQLQRLGAFSVACLVFHFSWIVLALSISSGWWRCFVLGPLFAVGMQTLFMIFNQLNGRYKEYTTYFAILFCEVVPALAWTPILILGALNSRCWAGLSAKFFEDHGVAIVVIVGDAVCAIYSVAVAVIFPWIELRENHATWRSTAVTRKTLVLAVLHGILVTYWLVHERPVSVLVANGVLIYSTTTVLCAFFMGTVHRDWFGFFGLFLIHCGVAISLFPGLFLLSYFSMDIERGLPHPPIVALIDYMICSVSAIIPIGFSLGFLHWDKVKRKNEES